MSISITIQDVDEATARWISEEAQRRGVSMETVILDLIHQGIRMECERLPSKTYHELDSLAGTWSEEQAMEFLKAIADFEQVDDKLWQ